MERTLHNFVAGLWRRSDQASPEDKAMLLDGEKRIAFETLKNAGIFNEKIALLQPRTDKGWEYFKTMHVNHSITYEMCESTDEGMVNRILQVFNKCIVSISIGYSKVSIVKAISDTFEGEIPRIIAEYGSSIVNINIHIHHSVYSDEFGNSVQISVKPDFLREGRYLVPIRSSLPLSTDIETHLLHSAEVYEKFWLLRQIPSLRDMFHSIKLPTCFPRWVEHRVYGDVEHDHFLPSLYWPRYEGMTQKDLILRCSARLRPVMLSEMLDEDAFLNTSYAWKLHLWPAKLIWHLFDCLKKLEKYSAEYDDELVYWQSMQQIETHLLWETILERAFQSRRRKPLKPKARKSD